MFKTVIVALSSALIAAASPALAAGTHAPEPAPAASPAPAPIAQKATKPVRYCIRETLTGSLVERKFCETREDWLKKGFDPLAK